MNIHRVKERRTSWPVAGFMITVLFVGALAGADEPPSSSIKSAVSTSPLVFMGRPVQITETSKSEFRATAKMTVEVLDVLVGSGPKKGDRLEIAFLTECYCERVYPVQFQISRETVFALKGRLTPGEAYSFESSLTRPDFAFVGGVLPIPGRETRSVEFEDVYTGRRETVLRSDLASWAGRPKR